jgi:hypothetical protein
MSALPWFEAEDIDGAMVNSDTITQGGPLLIVMLRGLF